MLVWEVMAAADSDSSVQCSERYKEWINMDVLLNVCLRCLNAGEMEAETSMLIYFPHLSEKICVAN